MAGFSFKRPGALGQTKTAAELYGQDVRPLRAPRSGASGQRSRSDEVKDEISRLLDSTNSQRTASRQANVDELDSINAENLSSVRARTGLAGMGLTGAAGAAEGTERRRGARNAQLTMDEFDARARSEDAANRAEAERLRENAAAEDRARSNDQRLRDQDARQAEADANARADRAYEDLIKQSVLEELEVTRNQDINKDGFIGNKAVGDTEDSIKNDERRAITDAIPESESYDYSIFDENSDPGSPEEPFAKSARDKAGLEEQGFIFTKKTIPGSGLQPDMHLWVDQDGNYWFFY